MPQAWALWQAQKTIAPVTVAVLDQTWHGLTPGEGLHAQFTRRFGSRANALLGRAGGVTETPWGREGSLPSSPQPHAAGNPA